MSLHHASCPPFQQGHRVFSVVPRGPTKALVLFLKRPSDCVPPLSAGRVSAETTPHPGAQSARRYRTPPQKGQEMGAVERQDPGHPHSCSCPLPTLPQDLGPEPRGDGHHATERPYLRGYCPPRAFPDNSTILPSSRWSLSVPTLALATRTPTLPAPPERSPCFLLPDGILADGWPRCRQISHPNWGRKRGGQRE